jgi:isocitrate/isopropylmalate dehydrogenase
MDGGAGERYKRTGEILPDSALEEFKKFDSIFLGGKKKMLTLVHKCNVLTHCGDLWVRRSGSRDLQEILPNRRVEMAASIGMGAGDARG